MKTIINWTAGSFFRTLGRLLLYICIGIIIANLVDFRDFFDNFRITDLFMERLDALTITSDVEYLNADYFSVSNTSGLTEDARAYFYTISNNTSVQTQWFNFTNALSTNNADYVTFGIQFGIPTQNETNHNYTTDSPFCDVWKQNSSGAWYCDHSFNVQSSNNDYVITDYEFDKLNISAYVTYADNSWLSCSMQENELVCPANRKNITSLRLDVLYNTTKTSSIKIGVQRGWKKYRIANIQGAIESQTQQQQQQHNETMNTITDTNTTSDVTNADSYFNNTSDNTPSGLTSAVTSPLRIFNDAINGTASPLCFTLNGKQSCLPTGSIIWNRNYGDGSHWFTSSYFNPKDAFITFFNLVVGGFLCYKMLLSMLRVYNDVVDPTSSKIEVLKL